MAELTGISVRLIGEILYGAAWRIPFESRFGITARNLSRVVAGKDTIHGDMARDIEMALRDHGAKLDAIMELFLDAV